MVKASDLMILADNGCHGTKPGLRGSSGRGGTYRPARSAMVIELVGQARRRFLYNEILAQGAWALSAAMGAVIILLLAGTQILDWQWLLLLPVATCAAGVWRTIRRLPSGYAIAQMVDRRLGLVDTLSTAFFFATGRADGGKSGGSPGVRAWQRTHAERLCERVRVSEAVPFTMPRAAYALAILGITASSLFALRYGLDRRLDLQKPLARILQQAFGLDRQQVAALDRKPPVERKPSKMKDMQGVSLNEGQLPGAGELQSAAANSAADANSPAQAESRTASSQSGKQANAGEEEAGEQSEAAEEQTGESASGEEAGQQDRQKKNGQEKAGNTSSQGSEGNNSSLMAKFREAMQNLLSRMKQLPTGGNGGQKQMAGGKNARQGKQQAGKGQSGQKGQQQSGGQESEGQEGQQGAQSQMAENAAGRGTGQSGEENASKQPGSGIGRQDGDKDVRLAEQLAAMGKISEIIGKRSANVSGEVTVEVQNGSQQLATPYANRSAAHGETSAEISRDEVPVALQTYVQQYFEQVRRQTGDTAGRDRVEPVKRP